MTDPASVLADLNRLGSADAVAEYFRANPSKGTRGDSCNCPIAIHLQRELGYLYAVSASTVQQVEDAEGVVPPLEAQTWLVPVVVSAFIDNFDGGLYPDLEVK